MASTIVTLVQTLATSLVLTHTSIALRVIVIAASEGILAIRTWAIWEKRQSILVLLCAVFSAALGVSVTLVLRGINGTHVLEIPERGCIKITNNKSQTYLLLPYLVLIFCECVTMSLSAARIFKWRHQISPTARTPLLDTLWNDGLLYFSWLIALGIVNSGMWHRSLILPPVRSAFEQEEHNYKPPFTVFCLVGSSYTLLRSIRDYSRIKRALTFRRCSLPPLYN
ncbi:hypothetical protein B0H15DRAFT_866326 [Mycena belliarum]|uniref:Uncharacterized protein n=1 Tax=Mycena belliarum TaxID=1033014 RepID=A0AAD6XFF2_9AGAR|nr:hypothetical protein B0H15DRAFT_866326 [Mycena belliae]